MWCCNVLVQLSHESSTEDATWPKTKASRDTVFFMYFSYIVIFMLIQVDSAIQISVDCRLCDLLALVTWCYLMLPGWMRKKRRSTFKRRHVGRSKDLLSWLRWGRWPPSSHGFPEPCRSQVRHSRCASKCRCSMMFHDVPWHLNPFDICWWMMYVCWCSGLAKNWTDLHREDWERVVAVWSRACFEPINQHVGLRWSDISWQPGRSRYRSGDCRRQVRICSKEMYD